MPPVEDPPELKSILDAHAEFLVRKLAESAKDAAKPQSKQSSPLHNFLVTFFTISFVPAAAVPLARATEHLIDKLKEIITDKKNTGEFVSQYAKSAPIPKKLTDADLTEAGKKFAKFASERGIKHSDLEGSFVEFVRSQTPGLQALAESQHLGKSIIPEPQPSEQRSRLVRARPEPRELWKNRKNRDESPVEFAARVYRNWMDEGVLARTDINALDPDLYIEINRWMTNNNHKRKPEPLPEGFNLLTKAEANDRWASLVLRGVIKIENASDAGRLAGILNRREKEHGGRKK